jgi:hypothetical protein
MSTQAEGWLSSEARAEQVLALVADAVRRNAQLSRALESRPVIEQAKGILAERFGLNLQSAFELLRRTARSNRIRIHELAQAVVADWETPEQVLGQLTLLPGGRGQREQLETGK